MNFPTYPHASTSFAFVNPLSSNSSSQVVDSKITDQISSLFDTIAKQRTELTEIKDFLSRRFPEFKSDKSESFHFQEDNKHSQNFFVSEKPKTSEPWGLQSSFIPTAPSFVNKKMKMDDNPVTMTFGSGKTTQLYPVGKDVKRKKISSSEEESSEEKNKLSKFQKIMEEVDEEEDVLEDEEKPKKKEEDDDDDTPSLFGSPDEKVPDESHILEEDDEFKVEKEEEEEEEEEVLEKAKKPVPKGESDEEELDDEDETPKKAKFQVARKMKKRTGYQLYLEEQIPIVKPRMRTMPATRREIRKTWLSLPAYQKKAYTQKAKQV